MDDKDKDLGISKKEGAVLVIIVATILLGSQIAFFIALSKLGL